MSDEYDEDGNHIEHLDDGSKRVTTPDGRSFTTDSEGNTNINLPTIRKITLDNIFDLISHTIMREGDTTIHRIVLRNEGEVRLVYTNAGDLIEFSGENIAQTITRENDVIIKCRTSE